MLHLPARPEALVEGVGGERARGRGDAASARLEARRGVDGADHSPAERRERMPRRRGRRRRRFASLLLGAPAHRRGQHLQPLLQRRRITVFVERARGLEKLLLEALRQLRDFSLPFGVAGLSALQEAGDGPDRLHTLRRVPFPDVPGWIA